MFLLSSVARYLFLPLAEAVVFAMLASYSLSRTIVPTMAKYLLSNDKSHESTGTRVNAFMRLQQKFDHHFEGLAEDIALCWSGACIIAVFFSLPSSPHALDRWLSSFPGWDRISSLT